MHAVGGLVLLGGVPPAIEVEDHRGAREIDSDAARKEAREEHPLVLFRVEAADDAAPMAGFAGEYQMLDLPSVQMSGENLDHLHVL